MKKKTEKQEQEEYSDEEVNELAEWLQDLSIKQAFFLKESYEAYLNQQIQACDSTFMH